MLEDEFIGVVFRDDEDGDTCYHVQITVLAEDFKTSACRRCFRGLLAWPTLGQYTDIFLLPDF